VPRQEGLNGHDLRDLQFREYAFVEFQPDLASSGQDGYRPFPAGHGALDDLLEPAEYLVGLLVGAEEAFVGL
jgi:hypothetical protein